MSNSDKVYETVRGMVQFDPRTREVNGKHVLDIAIRDRGSDGVSKLINITIWPEFQLTAPIKRGDFIAADGAIEARVYQADDGSTRTSISLSPASLVHVPAVAKLERATVVQAQPVAAAQVVQAAPTTQTVPF